MRPDFPFRTGATAIAVALPLFVHDLAQAENKTCEPGSHDCAGPALDAAPSEREEFRLGVVIGIGAGFHAGPLNELALFLEADVGYYALPWLVTSLAVEGAESNSEYGEHYESWLAAARAAAHPLAGFVVDPWVALDVGHAWAREDFEDGTYGDRDTAFVAGGIGIDVLAFDTAAFGLAIRHRIGFADRLGDQLGLRLEARL